MTNQAEMPAQAQATPGASGAAATPEAGSLQAQARGIVRRNVYWAIGMGLIPIPIVDFLALTGVQVKMLKELSDLYQVKFFEDKAKTIVGSLVASLGGLGMAGMAARSLFKLVPVVGQVVGMVGGSAFGGALTLAVGNLFAMHYESGGTLLTFDAEKLREHFRKEFEKAKDSVHSMQSEAKPEGPDSRDP